MADLGSANLNRPVGASFEYSNANYVVLGLLVERVSGQRWGDYVREHIFAPLGMAHSYTSIEEARANGLTDTYGFMFGQRRHVEGTFLEGLAPTGYLYSTVEDMARYLSLYLNGGEVDGARVLSAEGTEEMLTPATNTSTRSLQGTEFTSQYGMGWFVGAFGAAGDARWHLGTLPFFATWMALLPETGEAVVVMMNASSQLEVAGANAFTSRIPIGIVNMLRSESPPSGIGLTQFYVSFDLLLVAILALQSWSLVRLARGAGWQGWQAPPRAARMRFLAPLLWEVPLSLYLLLVLPAASGGWTASFRSLPDLTLAITLIAVLWLATAAVRVVRLVVGRAAPVPAGQASAA